MTKQAILLVAGRGSRLAPLTDTIPKCLLEVDGERLLIRLLRQLKEEGVETAVLVTGYLCEKIEEAVSSVSGLPKIEFAYNEAWNTANNAVSLRVGMAKLPTKDRFILLDGDLLICESASVGDLLQDSRENVIGASLQLPNTLGEEEMKFQLEPIDVAWGARRVIGLSKQLNPRFSHGESMGMQVIGSSAFQPVFDALHEMSREDEKNLYYEDVFARLIQKGEFDCYASAVDPQSWIEIDTSEDLSHARTKLVQWHQAQLAG